MPSGRFQAQSSRRTLRNRRVVHATLASLFSRVVGIAVNLAQVPIALQFLGPEAFGLWMTLVGTVHLMNFADLGLGLGLQNEIAAAYGLDDLQGIRDLHHTGRRLLAGLGLGVAAISLPLSCLLPWEVYFNAPEGPLARQLPYALAIVTCGFGLGLPLNAGVRLATGVQQGWLTGLGTTATSVLTLIAVIAARQTDASFGTFVAMTVAPLLLTNAAVGFLASRALGPTYGKLKGHYRSAAVSNLWRRGLLFLVPQLSASLMTAAPNIIIASVLGPTAVTRFSVCQRITGVLLQLIQLPLSPLWPAYAEAKTRGDAVWIKRAFRASLIYAFCAASGAGLGLVFLGEQVLVAWTGTSEALPDSNTLLGFAVWVAIVGTFGAITVFLNGCGVLKGQAVGGALSAASMLVTMPLLLSHFSLAGAVLSMTASWVIFCWPFVLRDLRLCWVQTQCSRSVQAC